MTIYDGQLLFDNAHAITASAISTNTLDMEAIRNLGIGNQLMINTLVTTTFTDSSSDSSLAVVLACSSTAGTQGVFIPQPIVATTPTFAYQLGTTSALSVFPPGQVCYIIPPLATPAGTATMVGIGHYQCYLNPDAINLRYVALIYVPLSGNLSAGAVTSFISIGPSKQSYGPSGFTIS